MWGITSEAHLQKSLYFPTTVHFYLQTLMSCCLLFVSYTITPNDTVKVLQNKASFPWAARGQ